MVPWGSLGDAQGHPGTSLEPPGGAGFQTHLKIHEKNDEFWEAPVMSWEAPGDPAHTDFHSILLKWPRFSFEFQRASIQIQRMYVISLRIPKEML